jgi:hypothetical protein
MKLLTISDGVGDSTQTPVAWYPNYFKWPEIVKLMTKGLTLNNCSKVGAGNEFIVNQLKQNLAADDMVIIQWSPAARFDLLLDHDSDNTVFWKNTIASDPLYSQSIVECGNNKFWLGSQSTTAPVQEYHQRYISLTQYQIRSQIYIDYATMLLAQRNMSYRFMLGYDSEYLASDANWIWHEPNKGLYSFKYQSKYKELDLDFAQPIPLVAFDFIKQYVMPDVNLHWRSSCEIDAVENMLYRRYQEAIKNKP